MDIAILTVLLVVGILLLLMEIFFLPGISVAGIAGVIFIGGAVAYAYAVMGTFAGNLTLGLSVVGLVAGIWLFIRSKALEKISLKTDIDYKIEPLKDFIINEGDEGITLSRLAPMGKIKINGAVVEAKSLDDFIDEGEKIEVLKVQSTNVIVKKRQLDNMQI